jgi:AraC-like DNA-binding protein
VKVATGIRTQPALRRFLGEEAGITLTRTLRVSGCVTAEWMDVSLPDDSIAEDTGMLYLFPVDDHKYCLQLFYLQYATESTTNATLCSLRFMPEFFDQFPPETLTANQPFRFDQTTEQQFSVCNRSRAQLLQLGDNDEPLPMVRSLQQTAVAVSLLGRALRCITAPLAACHVPACRFLAYDSERGKILEARHIIESNIEYQHTIRELSRKVAINECYLKKGFKALVGMTIHEYHQQLRIARAKELLHVQGHSVTDVANMLGYSSISHFSTAFKRVTGMKPCELLA